jgi:sec-independent protein translocase protein TatA
VFGQVGTFEIIFVLVIALVVLGPKRLPEVARSVGRGVREMRDAMTMGGNDEDDDEDEDRDGITDEKGKHSLT